LPLTKLTISIAEWWLTKLTFWISVPTYGHCMVIINSTHCWSTSYCNDQRL